MFTLRKLGQEVALADGHRGARSNENVEERLSCEGHLNFKYQDFGRTSRECGSRQGYSSRT